MRLPTDDQIHLWKIDHRAVTRPYPSLYALLNEEEKNRARRFVFDQHRHAFVLNRAALKLVLARYFVKRLDPKECNFIYNHYGKPSLPDMPVLQFNISHSADKALVAISANEQVGVDCEAVVKKTSVEKIASSQFSAAEYAQLTALPISRLENAFYQYWTRREATMKAVGLGFSLDIKELRFDQEEAFTKGGCKLLIPQCHDTAVVIKDCQSFEHFSASVARVASLGELTYFSLDDW